MDERADYRAEQAGDGEPDGEEVQAHRERDVDFYLSLIHISSMSAAGTPKPEYAIPGAARSMKL